MQHAQLAQRIALFLYVRVQVYYFKMMQPNDQLAILFAVLTSIWEGEHRKEFFFFGLQTSGWQLFKVTRITATPNLESCASVSQM